MAHRAVAAFGVVWVVLISGCKPPAPAFQPPPPPEVTVATPIERTLPVSLEFTGTTRGFETVEVRARVKGFLLRKHAAEGSRVKQGDLLFTIDPRTFEAAVRQAQAQVDARKSDLRLAEVTLSRVQEARRSNAVAQQEVDRAVAERDAAAAQVDLAEAALRTAQLDLEFTEVTAPITGRIGFMPVDEGQLVGASDPTLLGTIINDSKVYATYEVDERTLARLRRENEYKRPGEDGRPTYPVLLGMGEGVDYPFRGEFYRADNAVDPRTGTLRVEAIYDNPTGAIVPGSFVRLRAILGERPALLVPQTAVLQDQAGRYVLVVNGENKVERLPVRPAGPVYERMLPIEEALGDTLPTTPTEGGPAPARAARLTTATRIVVNGVQRARPGTEVKPAQATPTAGTPPAAGGGT